MGRSFGRVVLVGLLAFVVGCATLGGAMIGRGMGRIGGNRKAGTLIGAGVGMMVDIMR